MLRTFKTSVEDGKTRITCHRPYHVESLGFPVKDDGHQSPAFVTVEIASENNDVFRGFLDVSAAAELRDKLTDALAKARVEPETVA